MKMTRTAELIYGPANDGTGQSGWHVVIYEDGEHWAGYGTFRRLADARACAREHGARITSEIRNP